MDDALVFPERPREMLMTPSIRKKVLIGAGSVLGVLIVALLITPFFLDLNSFKPQIVAQV